MQQEWAGYYLDGCSAERQPATIRPTPLGLEVTTARGGTVCWPYRAIRQTQGFYEGEEVRLERGGELAEVLLVADAALLIALHKMAPGPAQGFHHPARRTLRRVLTAAAALCVIGITGALYAWGIPALAALATARVPASWEERLGQAVAAELAPPAKHCTDAARVQRIGGIVRRLTTAVPRFRYPVRVIVTDESAINAFAAPGGIIVIFRGLLERTRSAEELAGVLAHELQHIERRHVSRMLFQHASTALLLTVLTGDVTAGTAAGLHAAGTLGTLRYSRSYEEEADTEGLRLLVAAGVAPSGMIAFFEQLASEFGNQPAALKYLSTHPRPRDRIERLRRLAAELPRPAGALLPDYDWTDIRLICRTRGGS
jgi:beta-barrel assembly-enhancing protease